LDGLKTRTTFGGSEKFHEGEVIRPQRRGLGDAGSESGVRLAAAHPRISGAIFWLNFFLEIHFSLLLPVSPISSHSKTSSS
jgi:hypothetical protein